MLLQCFWAGLAAAVGALTYGFRLNFLKPYRALIWHEYAVWIAIFGVLLAFNVTFLLYRVCHEFSMKTTGRKLQHMERGMRQGGSVMEELSEKLEAQ